MTSSKPGLIERLRNLRGTGFRGPVVDVLQEAADELTRYRSALEGAREALEPFAKAAAAMDESDKYYFDTTPVADTHSIYQFRYEDGRHAELLRLHFRRARDVAATLLDPSAAAGEEGE